MRVPPPRASGDRGGRGPIWRPENAIETHSSAEFLAGVFSQHSGGDENLVAETRLDCVVDIAACALEEGIEGVVIVEDVKNDTLGAALGADPLEGGPHLASYERFRLAGAILIQVLANADDRRQPMSQRRPRLFVYAFVCLTKELASHGMSQDDKLT